MSTAALALGLVLGAAPSPSPESSPEPTPEELAQRDKAPRLGPLPTPAYIDEVNRRWRGVGVGYDNGIWGSDYAQSLKIDIPFGWRVGQFFGLRVRGTMVHVDVDDDWDAVFNTGLELFGRGPVFYGIMRVYGGGGAWVGLRPSPVDPDDGSAIWAIAGGGHFGVEFLLAPRVSLQIEIGGQSPGHALGHDAGAHVMGGFMVYTGRGRPKS